MIFISGGFITSATYLGAMAERTGISESTFAGSNVTTCALLYCLVIPVGCISHRCKNDIGL
ncbi:MAG: hypothetical protein NTW49_13970 [Bacteroidia bacterium]|nr:hypothetical protein [Bacteroidia bacterium]